MRIVLQRVRRASVSIDGTEVATIEAGLLALVGVGRGDDHSAARTLAAKTATLRLFPGTNGEERPFDRSVAEVGGAVLVVSQFTLHGDVRRGNRPSWSDSAPADVAQPIVAAYVDALRAAEVAVQEGRFGAHMDVALVNDGPVTLVLDSDELARSRRA